MAGSGQRAGDDTPPILTLLDASELHRGAIEYDWRARFGVQFDPPHAIGWCESTRLFFELLKDPGSHTAAAIGEWSHPASRELLGLLDLFDLHRQINHDPKKGNFKPSPRPWPDPNKKRIGKATRPQAEIRAALATRGHGTVTPIRPNVRPRDSRGRFVSRRG